MKSKLILLSVFLCLFTIPIVSHRSNAVVSNTSVQTVSATGDGSTVNFTIGFDFRDNTQVIVYRVDTSSSPSTQTLIAQGSGASKFTITGGNPGTTVHMGTAPTTSQHLLIQRSIPLTQPVSYDEASAFPASDHEAQMDRMTMLLQQEGHDIGQKIGLSPTSTASPIPTLPDPYADRFILYNHTGTDFTLGPSSANSLATNDILQYNGSTWTNVQAGTIAAGTVTSVDMSVPSFLSVSGNPVTGAGTLAVGLSGTALPVTSGGTGSTSLTPSGVLLGAGTSAPTVVAPSTSGNVLTSNGTTWVSSPASGGLSSIGTIDSVAGSANGLIVSGSAIIAQSASGTQPGLVSSGVQTLAGVKTFTSTPIISSLSTSGVLVGDGSGNITEVAPSTANFVMTSNGPSAPPSFKVSSGGVTTVGTIDSQSSVSNGLTITGSSIVAQTASATQVGLVSSGAQTFAGLKTFSTPIAATSGGTAQSTYATGDILYASGVNLLGKLTIGASGTSLTPMGTGPIPAWLRNRPGGRTNYADKNPNADVDTQGWLTYADANKNIPTDGVAGTATGLTFSRSTSSPLHGSGQFSLVKDAANRQGSGVSFDFAIDPADQAKVLQIGFDYNASTGMTVGDGITAPLNDGTTIVTTGNSDLEVFVYDITGGAIIPVSPQVLTAKGNNNYSFKGTFQTASGSTAYRLVEHVAASGATAWTFLSGNYFVGPQPVSNGSPITDWSLESRLTPSASWGTTTGATFYSRRVGKNFEVYGFLPSASATANPAYIQLPAGMVIDTTVVTADAKYKFGDADYYTPSSTITLAPISLFYDGSTTNQLFFSIQSGTGGYNKANASVLDPMIIRFSVPIAGWGSTVSLSNDTDTRVVSAIVSGDPASATVGNPIIVPTVGYDSHGAYSTSTGRYTVPVSGIYKMYGSLQSASSATTLTIYKNAASTALAGNLDSNGEATFAGAVNCVAGDLIDLRPGGTVDATAMTLNIERLSGPASIAATDSIGFRYFASSTTISGSLATIVWTTKDWDTHGGMSSGTYTVPVGGRYQCNAEIKPAATYTLNNTSVIELQKNGTVVSRQTAFAAAAVTDLNAQVSDLVTVVAGDTLRIQASNSGTSPSIASSNFENYFSCHRVGN